MTRYASLCVAACAWIFGGCSQSSRTVVLDWTGDMAAPGDSIATVFANLLGANPDSLQRCSKLRVRVAFVNQPGGFAVSSQPDGNRLVQSGPGMQVERNVVRSIAYAVKNPLERFAIDTLVVTLTWSERGGGGQRSSYQVIRSELNLSKDVFGSYSVPVTPVSLVEQPCGSTRN